MAADAVFAFWTAALVLIATPGADWAFTLGAGLRGGSTRAAVAGLVIGYALVTAVVAGGVGALVAATPAVLTALAVVGGAYLVWHGAVTFARPAAAGTDAEARRADVPGPSPWRLLLKGVGVSGLNPKGLLIMVALLPQFTDPATAWPVSVQLAVLGLVFTATCAVFYLCLGALARTVLASRPGAARGLGRVAGAAMVLIGAGLLAGRFLA